MPHRNRASEGWRRAKPLSRHPISGLTGTLAQCNCCFGHEWSSMVYVDLTAKRYRVRALGPLDTVAQRVVGAPKGALRIVPDRKAVRTSAGTDRLDGLVARLPD